jgi:hypothetical protein
MDRRDRIKTKAGWKIKASLAECFIAFSLS